MTRAVATTALKTVAEASVWATLFLGLAVLTAALMPAPAFAGRWDGGCRGWTKGIALHTAANAAAYWYSYTLIAVAIIRLHPVMNRVWSNKVTVPIIAAVFFSCGGSHMVDAVAVWYPHYDAKAVYDTVGAVVAVAGGLLVTLNLALLGPIMSRDRRRAEEVHGKLDEEYGRHGE